MSEFYGINEIKTVATYTRYAVSENGDKILKTLQTITHNKLMSREELKAEAESRIAPGETIEVVFIEE